MELPQIPEWLTARYQDGEIKGCREGTKEYYHEVGHKIYSNNNYLMFFTMVLQYGGLLCLAKFIFSDTSVYLRLGLGLFIFPVIFEELFSESISILNYKKWWSK